MMVEIRQVGWAEAEAHAGRRLDRRRSYAIGPSAVHDDERIVVLELARWVQSCTGCCELGDYGAGSGNYRTDRKHGCLIGGGCHECGYTGKRSNAQWIDMVNEVGA